ncbi:carbon-nitrogen hydrolase family protein [Solimonas sp. K1W22B-7]|uniref:carbon-nitrogen hydrolase family protein n=1 Tax=Solimonas sp. K1W22B-7 TaxID=2303331 RepID=UPI000E32EA67|nr:carbon-nitrogen hydrolase family protein [Solimonas sp. K1W22B-7]AXQ28266.1 carbon-nitrogen hydrolase family protein [Solimonas sp. K1W22B-7]
MNPAIAAIQMNSSDRLSENLAVAEQMLREAARQGAWLAVLPENFAFMGARERDKLAHAELPGKGPIQAFLSAISRELRLWVVAGTIPQAVPEDPERVLAASLVYAADGTLASRYDKIHLFDVEVPGGESYRESRSIRPGEPNTVVAATAVGNVGLSVCYDLRFPELYRLLATAGADILCVPSAFTARTGEAHWETLLRARAIENQCYVVAPNQWGEHAGGRRTWGHSMIVGPWGEVLACQDDGSGVVLARPDRAAQAKLRQDFPVLSHRRLA